ncbi:MAG: hypothetical protein GWN79_15365, partial [Actinobacteria bacterium]|nr:hypothetical protein [Actinomycetota bacterium]NIT96679.1 hypothetical protein [Actinomycetota bacterium]NIU20372.1 hypothetical protein [Actinomycetota bacterium]NIU68072.1 hypothetical protein [Actinomycetota bacterium]NIV56847.1 hypothetical protein [Actinomycetota bacterium]
MTTSPRRPRTSPRRPVVASRPTVSKGRVACVAVGMTLVTAGFGWRLVDLQLRPDPALAGQIGSQVREQVIEAPRGDILDRHGRTMALSLTRPSIIADPRLVPAAEVDDIVGQLAAHLSTDPAVIERRLRSGQAFVFLERQVEPAVGDAVLALGLPGISSQDEPYRDHPNRECSGLSVIGRVDIDQVGISGLEERFDDHLTGEPGLAVRETQRGGDVRIPGGYQVVTAVEPGLDLHLTLDRNIQYEAEQLLVEALERTGGGKAMAIVTDPATGEIHAMANAVRDAETGEARCTTTNLAATWTYEPGSIMKALTFAAVLENGAWDEHTPVHIPSVISVARGAGMADHNYTDVNLRDGDATHPPSWIMAKSSNNGTIRLATKLGADPFQSTLERLGIGERTALEFKGEASGILDDLDSHGLMLS